MSDSLFRTIVLNVEMVHLCSIWKVSLGKERRIISRKNIVVKIYKVLLSGKLLGMLVHKFLVCFSFYEFKKLIVLKLELLMIHPHCACFPNLFTG